ncbi:LCP family protein [Frondihabitans australicus]|uniref:LytR family transcriptional attenuator n=1 Tax=Frondihabitans australicus TaxID=386892 RepID=A0A495IJU6_9MICO|nr:LCP family protein [Frondihabitans australicus]RKR76292.1 LytR family transcriptional attenuator [Frondihabitans australicus]
MTDPLDRLPAPSPARDRSRRAARSAPLARHGRLPRRSPWKALATTVAAAVAVVAVSGAAVGAIALKQVSDDLGPGVALQGEKTEPAVKQPGAGLAAYKGGFNILIVGTDNDPKQGTSYGVRDATLNDVNILLHVSADHTNATAVSIPRDLVVPIPSCPRTDGQGSTSAQSAAPINSAYGDGGLNCVVQTVKQLTGVDIPFAGQISFNGVIEMSNAIGGVPVCVNKPIHDRYTGLNLPAGTSTLSGADALAFLRSRHGVGDGSDLGRISSQQVYLSSMLRTIKSGGVLGSPTKLYGLARAAASNMTLSNSLNSTSTLISMGSALRDLDLSRVNFVQYPGSTAGTGIYADKVQPDTATAAELFGAIKADRPFTVPAGSTGIGSESSAAAGTGSGAATGAAGGSGTASAGAGGAGAAGGSSAAAGGSGAAGSAAGSGAAGSAGSSASGSSGGATAPATIGSGASTGAAISGLTGQTAADQTCSVAYRF